MNMWKATYLAGVICLLFSFSAEAAERSVRIDPHRKAVLTDEHQIVLEVLPHDGDAWTRLALRICGDAAVWSRLAEINGRGPNLLRGVPVKVPFDLVKPEMQLEIVQALFPRSTRVEEGWVHEIVSASGVEGESLWRIAEWFAGEGSKFTAIRQANPGQALSTKPGQRVLIPEHVLREAFRREPAETGARVVAQARSRQSADGGRAVPAVDRATPAVARREASPLSYELDAAVPYAVYRLREGEAIYSSVAIRFTGRIHAEDVNQVIEEIVQFSGIGDVSKLPVGYPVRIPMSLLTPEFRPAGDPLREEWERLRQQRELLSSGIRANRLEGVHVIIDPGHGGRDVGASSKTLYEAVYVYDIVSRMKRILENETGATVWVTTRSKKLGYSIPDRDVLEPVMDHMLLTTPNYDLSDPVAGVNLRWYLANAIYHRVRRERTDSDKVVFLSVHADSLHASLRGAMVYVPGERHVRDVKFSREGPVYLARAEVREQPTVEQSAEEALRGEAYSTRLAESIIESFRREGLEVHPFDPVRSHVVRDRREWVPAVIRYNKVPARVLVEVGNLANAEDRKLLQTRKWREQAAQALAKGVVGHFESRAESPSDYRAVAAAR
jgi:N-acetylmuramoyl-L-alanine amidase